MRKSRFFPALAFAALLLAAALGAAGAATYNGVFANDGTYTWFWQLNASHQAQLYNATGNPPTTSSAMLTVDLAAGPMVPVFTVATLPTCNAAVKGAIAMVTDATTPTYNGALTGGGAVVVPVACSGSAWTSH